MNDRLSIVLFSGTADKLMAAANLAAGAAAAGREVTVFLTFGGLLAFRKDDWKHNHTVSADLGPYAEVARKALQHPATPTWMEILKTARELGPLKLTACRMTLEMFGLQPEDLEPVVTELSTVNDFLEAARQGSALFI